ncbi:MAG: alpha/beta hydrolase, partial [Betaproteobacteria bacterium]
HGEEQRIDTREGVSVPIFTYWQSDAVATVVLFSGGGGGYGRIDNEGWPSSGNFLIRTGRHWASHPFNIVMVGLPTDAIDLALGGIRTGARHAADNLAIFKAIKLKSTLPIWLVGTSMGTISATAAAIQDSENLVAGIVLTSSITGYRIDGAVPKQDLEHIRVPTLVFHHQDDACKFCQAHEAKDIAGQLKNAPIKKTMIVTGGSGATGNTCGAFHYHGYIGMENEAVDMIAAWILKPTE